MGFLDKQSRIIDLILTDEGRRQLAAGTLVFDSYAFFDDGIDYDPVIMNSGSLSVAQMSASVVQQIEESLVLEANSGMGNRRYMDDDVSANCRLFTMPQGQKILPRLSLSPAIVSGTVVVSQRKVEETIVKKTKAGQHLVTIGPVDRGFERVDTTAFTIDLDVQDFFADEMDAGITVELFRSGSDGLVPALVVKDSENDDTVDGTIKFMGDDRRKKVDVMTRRRNR